MADNPNKTSTRSNFHGDGGHRRNGAPSNSRLMEYGDNDRGMRNQYFHPTRSRGRHRSERPSTSLNNRNIFEKSPSSNGNQNRTERSPSARHYPERVRNRNGHAFAAGNYEQPSLGNTEPQSPELASEARNPMGVCRNLENEDPYNGDGDINHRDQEMACSTKLKDTSNMGHLYSISKKKSNTHQSQDSLGTSNGLSDKGGDSGQGSTMELSNPKFCIGSFYSPRYPEHSSSYDDPSPQTTFNLPSSDRNETGRCVSSATNPPRPIKGCWSKNGNSSVGLPRPITKLNDINCSEVVDLPHTITSGALNEGWANAPEFYPKGSKPKSYADVVSPRNGQAKSENPNGKKMCPYAERSGECRVPDGCCPYIHGDICELCSCATLHPTDVSQRNAHHQKCLARHEKEMELSFAVARSKEKTCGICFEIVVEKAPNERRFGILNQCNHCFCLGCIRKWRQARQFENKVVRACPECRITSDFVCPSLYWVETKEEKEKLIGNYKNALAQKQCKYFKQGRGSCPFGNKCFYLHALPDGTKTDVGPPPRRRRANHSRYPDDAELGDMLQQIILWDFLDEHDHHWLYSFADDIEELVAFFSDSDESESWSDYEFLLD